MGFRYGSPSPLLARGSLASPLPGGVMRSVDPGSWADPTRARPRRERFRSKGGTLMASATMSNVELQREVLEELKWEPSVNPAHIGVSVKDSVVTLTGHVSS